MANHADVHRLNRDTRLRHRKSGTRDVCRVGDCCFEQPGPDHGPSLDVPQWTRKRIHLATSLGRSHPIQCRALGSSNMPNRMSPASSQRRKFTIVEPGKQVLRLTVRSGAKPFFSSNRNFAASDRGARPGASDGDRSLLILNSPAREPPNKLAMW